MLLLIEHKTSFLRGSQHTVHTKNNGLYPGEPVVIDVLSCSQAHLMLTCHTGKRDTGCTFSSRNQVSEWVRLVLRHRDGPRRDR